MREIIYIICILLQNRLIFHLLHFPPFKLYSLCWYNQKIATCVQKEKYNKHLNFYHLFHIFQQNTPKKKINIIIIDS